MSEETQKSLAQAIQFKKTLAQAIQCFVSIINLAESLNNPVIKSKAEQGLEALKQIHKS